MTSHLAADDDAPSTEAVTTNVRRRRFALAAGLLAAVVVVAGAAATWHWRTHPEALPDAGNGLSMELQPGDTTYVGVTDPYPGSGPSITINSASARVAENSADARIRFFVCALDTDRPDAGAIGIVDATTFSEMCPNPEPVAPGTDLDVGAERPEQLVAAITVHQRGEVRTEGVDLSYMHGWQNGTQTVSASLAIRSR